jgi:multiple sugar transport system ATP-binding protein
MAFLEVVDLYKSFGSVSVLQGIDIAVEKGGFLVLVGPSGCGKSTLLNTIAGLETLTSGEVRINGQMVNDLHPSKRDIAMVFQSYALYPSMNIAQNIAFGMEMRGVPKPDRERAVDEVARMLKIDHLLDRRPGQLSGGQRQRVAMGRALVRDPLVFLFDEPLSNLDAELRVEMRTEIKRLHQNLGATVVYVTHDQVEAMTLATQIAVLKDGVLQQVGSPSEVYARPANLFVADFMGSPAMNLIEAKVGGAGDALHVEMARDGGDLRLPVRLGPQGLAAMSGGPVIFGIRPEDITDPDGVDRQVQHVETVACEVEVVEPTGSDTFVVTRIGGKEVTARMRAGASAVVGETREFAFAMDHAHYFDPDSGQRV